MGEYNTFYKDIGTLNAHEKLKEIQDDLRSIRETSYNLSRRKSYCVDSH